MINIFCHENAFYSAANLAIVFFAAK